VAAVLILELSDWIWRIRSVDRPGNRWRPLDHSQCRARTPARSSVGPGDRGRVGEPEAPGQQRVHGAPRAQPRPWRP